MFYFIISLLLGVLPDILYYYLYLKEIKNIKSNKMLFVFLIFVFYMISNILIVYNFYIYIIFDIAIYWIMKFLYKSQINDIFLIFFIELYMIIISTFSFYMIPYYYVAFIIYRILMFLPLIFKNKIKKMYKIYNSLWNRHDKKNKIKSITLRNISLVLLNFLIVFMYVVLLSIINLTR